MLIARCLLLADATPTLRPLIPPRAITLTRRFLDQAAPSHRLDFALRHAWSRRLLLAVERFALPGIIRHYLVRKQCIESHVRDFLHTHRDGQLVVLGAGLDTLAWRLQAQGTASSFELDHPATQTLKRQANIQPAPHLLPVDFTGDCPAAALATLAGYSSAKPTVFVAEGLLMYLPTERVAELLSALARATVADSRLVFTFMERRPNQSLGFRGGHRLVTAWLRWKREPFLWGEDRAMLATFLARHGWTLEKLGSPQELRERFLIAPEHIGQPLAEGECIAIANRA
ncbi:MAG: SAM-dependent methyltransferase [Burkholderiales bacterium]|nr:SAM-dependent methyltransferase [Opitutaceae bacterium]